MSTPAVPLDRSSIRFPPAGSRAASRSRSLRTVASARPDPARSSAPYRLYNIGNNRPETLATLVALIEKHTGRRLATRLIGAQPGDVVETYANVDALAAAVGYRPTTTLDEGIGRFVAWYREYHNV